MPFSSEPSIIASAAAAATVLVIFFSASSLDQGRRRLILVFNTLGIAVVAILGFDDSREGWTSFWDETVGLWRSPRRTDRDRDYDPV